MPTKYPTRKIGHKKAIGEISAAFAHSGAKRNRMTTSEHCLDMFKRNPKEFLRRFVTVDEIWVHHYTPEMKEQSKQYTSSGERAAKKAKTFPSAGR